MEYKAKELVEVLEEIKPINISYEKFQRFVYTVKADSNEYSILARVDDTDQLYIRVKSMGYSIQSLLNYAERRMKDMILDVYGDVYMYDSGEMLHRTEYDTIENVYKVYPSLPITCTEYLTMNNLEEEDNDFRL